MSKSTGIILSFILLALFAYIFIYTPLGGVNAFKKYLDKRNGITCGSSFCFKKATKSAYYEGYGGAGSGSKYYCEKHAFNLTERKDGGGGIWALLGAGVFLGMMIKCFNSFGEYFGAKNTRINVFKNLRTIFVCLVVANFSIWLFILVFD